MDITAVEVLHDRVVKLRFADGIEKDRRPRAIPTRTCIRRDPH